MKRNVKVLIVEDEFITLDNLRDTLEEINYEISGDAMKAEEAIEILEKGETDIAIIDIQLKGAKNGIWLAEQINEKFKIPFIYLSAYSDPKTVKEATETNPYAYLVKPFTPADIFTAIEVALTQFSNRNSSAQVLDSEEKSKTEFSFNDSIFVKENLVFHKIQLSDILFIEAFKNYIELNFNDNKYVIRSTLKNFLNILPNNHFLQTHRSFVININHVEKIGVDYAMIGKEHIPITKNYKDSLMTKINFL